METREPVPVRVKTKKRELEEPRPITELEDYKPPAIPKRWMHY